MITSAPHRRLLGAPPDAGVLILRLHLGRAGYGVVRCRRAAARTYGYRQTVFKIQEFLFTTGEGGGTVMYYTELDCLKWDVSEWNSMGCIALHWADANNPLSKLVTVRLILVGK